MYNEAFSRWFNIKYLFKDQHNKFRKYITQFLPQHISKMVVRIVNRIYESETHHKSVSSTQC